MNPTLHPQFERAFRRIQFDWILLKNRFSTLDELDLEAQVDELVSIVWDAGCAYQRAKDYDLAFAFNFYSLKEKAARLLRKKVAEVQRNSFYLIKRRY